MVSMANGKFRTLKAARQAGLRTEDEWKVREQLPDRSRRVPIIPRRDAEPILVNGEEETFAREH